MFQNTKVMQSIQGSGSGIITQGSTRPLNHRSNEPLGQSIKIGGYPRARNLHTRVISNIIMNPRVSWEDLNRALNIRNALVTEKKYEELIAKEKYRKFDIVLVTIEDKNLSEFVHVNHLMNECECEVSFEHNVHGKIETLHDLISSDTMSGYIMLPSQGYQLVPLTPLETLFVGLRVNNSLWYSLLPHTLFFPGCVGHYSTNLSALIKTNVQRMTPSFVLGGKTIIDGYSLADSEVEVRSSPRGYYVYRRIPKRVTKMS